MAWGVVLFVVSTSVVLAAGIDLVWLLRTIPLSVAGGVLAWGKSLIEYTCDARNIIWESQFSPSQPEQKTTDTSQTNTSGKRGAFPSPEGNGLLVTSVTLTDAQHRGVAQEAVNNGKLRINALMSMGIKRGDAERLRSELAGHELIFFNAKGEAVVTNRGYDSFGKVINKN
jgi:hypothetical protein